MIFNISASTCFVLFCWLPDTLLQSLRSWDHQALPFIGAKGDGEAENENWAKGL